MTTSQPQPALRPGLTYRESMVVADRHTVPRVAPEWPGFVDMPAVFATAMMIGFIEQTCVTALRPYLSDGQRTVGTHVDVSHLAATPEGAAVTATVTLTELDGRNLRFDVACHDEAGLIGAGTHHRAVVDLAKFIRRVDSRRPATTPGPARGEHPAQQPAVVTDQRPRPDQILGRALLTHEPQQ